MEDENNDDLWPLPKFYFLVKFGDQFEGSFQEVFGLDTESQPIEYRASDSKIFSTIKKRGVFKHGNATLKKGLFPSGEKVQDFFNEIKLNTIKRQNVTILLLDENHNPTMSWTLTNAFLTKVSGTDLNADGNEVAIETIELAFEGITMEQG